jgi:uncharacterized protein YoxC
MYLAITALAVCLFYQVMRVPVYIGTRLDEIVERIKHRDDQLKKILQNTNDMMEDNYWTTKANIETTAVILRDVSEIARQFRSDVMPELSLTIKEFRFLTQSLRDDFNDLSSSGSEALLASAGLIRQLESLTEELEVQITQGSPKVIQTVESIDKVLVDIEKHISNPDLYAIANNLKGITGNTAEITKTVDVATRPLREKVKLIKAVLLRLIGMIRVQPL